MSDAHLAQAWLELDQHIDALWRALLTESRASSGALYAYGRYHGERMVDACWGSPPPDEAHALYLSADEPWSSQRRARWTVCAPRPHHLNRFAPLSEDLQPATPTQHTHHALLYHGELIVGHALLSRPLAPIQTLTAGLNPLKDALGARWNAQISKQLRPKLLLNAHGELRSWCALAQALIGEDELPGLRDAFTVSLSRKRFSYRCFEAHITTLDQQEPLSYLLSLSRPSPLKLDLFDALSPTQHQITEGVRCGLSNAQLAASLQLSIDGVKYHLKQIYAQLGASNRAELAALSTARQLNPQPQRTQ